jgi:hypothetical protein
LGAWILLEIKDLPRVWPSGQLGGGYKKVVGCHVELASTKQYFNYEKNDWNQS